jgi:hypothetical protein
MSTGTLLFLQSVNLRLEKHHIHTNHLSATEMMLYADQLRRYSLRRMFPNEIRGWCLLPSGYRLDLARYSPRPATVRDLRRLIYPDRSREMAIALVWLAISR